MSKIHLAEYERPTESDPHGDWSDTICGLDLDSRFLTNNPAFVTCKKCKREMDKNKNEKFKK